MTLTAKDINQIQNSHRIKISDEEKTEILRIFGQEPDDYHFRSEQDIYEQVRKICKNW